MIKTARAPYMKDLIKRLKRNPYLRDARGYHDKAPTEAHFSQMKKRIGAEGFRVMEAWLRREALSLRASQPLSATGLIQATFMDCTDARARMKHIARAALLQLILIYQK